MDTRLALGDLVTSVLSELKRLQYTANSQAHYRRLYQRVLAYAREHGVRDYSEDFARQFFEATFHVSMRDLPQPVPQKFRHTLRILRSLGDYQLHGALLRRRPQKAPYTAPASFRRVLDDFARECKQRGYSSRAAPARWKRLCAFVDYVAAQGVPPEAITARHLSQYTATLVGYHPKTVATMLTTVRTFLKFLHQTGHHAQDLSVRDGIVRPGMG